MERRFIEFYKNTRRKVDLDGTFNDDTAKFREKMESTTIFGASVGGAIGIIVAMSGEGQLKLLTRFPKIVGGTLIGACAGATYMATVRGSALVTKKDWYWNHVAGGLAAGYLISYAVRSPAMGPRLGIPLGVACGIYKSRKFDDVLTRPDLGSRGRTFSPWGYRGVETYETETLETRYNELVGILRDEDEYGKN